MSGIRKTDSLVDRSDAALIGLLEIVGIGPEFLGFPGAVRLVGLFWPEPTLDGVLDTLSAIAIGEGCNLYKAHLLLIV